MLEARDGPEAKCAVDVAGRYGSGETDVFIRFADRSAAMEVVEYNLNTRDSDCCLSLYHDVAICCLLYDDDDFDGLSIRI